MSDERKRRRWPWAILVILVLYLMGIGPLVRYSLSTGKRYPYLEMVYWPLDKAATIGVVRIPLAGYIKLWCPEHFRATYGPDFWTRGERSPNYFGLISK